ncbi:MAG: O-antigen ligase family protein [Aridibacter sp.]
MLGIFYLVGLSIITFNLVDEVNLSRQVCFAWLLGSLIAAIITVITIFLFYFDRTNVFLRFTLSTYGSLPPGNYPRINSSFLNANMFCHYLSISWTILLISYQFKWINKPIFIILSILFGIAVIFTISPSIGGVLLIIGLFGGVYYKEKSRFTFSRISYAIGICLAIFFFLITTVSIGFENSAKVNSLSNLTVTPSVRIQTWQSAFQTFTEYPIFGQGIATNAAEVVFTSPAGEKQFLTDAHQLWLNVAAQEGLFGVFAITFLGIYLTKRSLPFTFENKKGILRTSLAIGFISAFFYQGLTGSYEDARHLWILIGFLGAVTKDNFDT